MVERVKGGVKLFIGRLPTEATQQMLRDAMNEYGEVLEVFLIDSSRGFWCSVRFCTLGFSSECRTGDRRDARKAGLGIRSKGARTNSGCIREG